MKTVFFIVLQSLVAFLCPSLVFGQTTDAHTAAPNVQVMAEAFTMPQLNRSRRIWIYLPPDYEASTDKRYPVLYMQDGQNLFDEALAWMNNEWKVDETLNAFFEEGLESVIVVGIEHGEEHRGQEYAPWVRDVNGVTEGGEGDEYVDFLVNTLKPYVDTNFRTLPAREHTGVAGSSLGGLISLYAALKYPQIIGKVGAISPALWFNPEIIDYAGQQPSELKTRFYFVTSKEEGDGMIGRINQAYEALLAQGHKEEDIKRVLTETGAHDEIYYGQRFQEMYLWLYEPQQRPPDPDPAPTGLTAVDAAAAGISLYPNPAQHQFQLLLPPAWRGRAQGYFIDVQGRRLSPVYQLMQEEPISVADLPHGLLFLVIQTDTQRTVLRVVKD